MVGSFKLSLKLWAVLMTKVCDQRCESEGQFFWSISVATGSMVKQTKASVRATTMNERVRSVGFQDNQFYNRKDQKLQSRTALKILPAF